MVALCPRRLSAERQPATVAILSILMYLTLAQSDFSTCEVSDALIKLGVPHGGHIPDIHCISSLSPSENGGRAQGVPVPVRLCGPAYTVRMVFLSDRDAPKLQQSHFVDLAPEGSIAFVSAPSGWSSRCSSGSSSYIAYPVTRLLRPLCSALPSELIH